VQNRQQLQGIPAIICFAYNLDVAGIFQEPTNAFTDQMVIIDHDDTNHIQTS
jgi:hypothetical protein